MTRPNTAVQPPSPRRLATFYVAPVLTDADDIVAVPPANGLVTLQLMDRLAVRADSPVVFERLINAARQCADSFGHST